MTMPRLLVIDDEPSVCYSFRRVFGTPGTEVATAETGAAGLEQLQIVRPDVVVLDLQLPDRSGLDVFHDIQAADPKRPVIFITAHGTTDTAIEAMKRGAFDYLVKPVDFERVRQVLDRAFEAARLMQVPAELPQESGPDRIIGRSSVIQEMSKAIGRVAAQEVNVLIVGESGTGKELVARAIYHHSNRASKPFLAVNCAALPESLVESELFGHEQGAFTGAQRQRIGKFEQCSDGTILLDEIGDMTLGVQAKMLRLLQEQQFERVGGNRSITTHVRVLAATNQNLEQLIAEGKFRSDLYYRLKVVTIHVPPLRDRNEDIPELSHHFLYKFNTELNLGIRSFTPEALDILQHYRWPGNVRELQGAIKATMLRTTASVIRPEDLRAIMGRDDAETAPAEAAQESNGDLIRQIDKLLADGQKNVYDRAMRLVEFELLSRALRQTHGFLGQASEILGISRTTLRSKLRDLGIALERTVSERPEDGEESV
jgi:two-component system nitrogen regulation response regulator GlnG